MSNEYHAIKWIDNNTVSRRTREVDLICYIESGSFEKDGEYIKGVRIRLEGTADFEHHLIEDAAILLKKMAQIKCGEGH